MANSRRMVRDYAEMMLEFTNGKVGLTMSAPGDGVTRYKLGTSSAADGKHDYSGDRSLAVAVGAADAVRMCKAFLEGYWYAKQVKE